MINKHWFKSELLNKDKKAAYKHVQKQGITICFDSYERMFAKQTFNEINKIFRNELLKSSLSLIYLYDQSQQPPNISKCDGYSSIFEYAKGDRKISAIGISIQALHYQKEYAIMVFLHELAHILCKTDKEHDVMFHCFLDSMIERYNKSTGESVKNDYYGLPV